MAYTAWSVTFGEQPSAAKWNQLGSNDASFNDGTGIANDVITSAHLKYGLIRNRQGGTTGDAAWYSTGNSNTDTDAKDVFLQAGLKGITANPTTLTFPTAYTYAPLVLATTGTAGSANVFTVVTGVTTTTSTIRQLSDAGVATTTEAAAWLTIGQ